MKTVTKTSWPKNLVDNVDCRKCDLVIRITNWLNDKDEPGYDVEIYNQGAYDWNESKTFTLYSGLSKSQAKSAAISFAQEKIKELLN